MKVLGIDTSLSVATVCVLDNDKILGEISVNVKNKHSETLMPIIKNLLDTVKIKPNEIKKVVCGIGPGSFTGLRIGIATAKAFAYSNNIKIIPMPTLTTLATNIKYTDKLIVPIIDGKRENIYYGTYKYINGTYKRIDAMAFTNINELLNKLEGKDAIFTGDGVVVYKDLIEKNDKFQIADNKHLLTNATNMTLYAIQNFIDEEVTANELKPMYLRKSQAERDYILKNIENIKYETMEHSHIDGVYEIEKNTFPMPWSKDAFIKELVNDIATYYVAVFDDEIVAYGGMWIVAGDANITNIAVREEYKKMGIGEKLVEKLINRAKNNNCTGITLEVRVSNNSAINLYKKKGFEIEGLRKKFYTDNNEDAHIMWLKFQ